MSLSFLVRKHGEKAGLLFTDAAHELLDYSSPKHGEKAGQLFTDAAHELLDYSSPVLSRSCSVVSRPCSSADPKVSESKSDASLCRVAFMVVFLLLIIVLRV